MKTYIVVLALVACICYVQCNEQMKPLVVTDSFGNYADKNSKLTYAEVPAGEEYVVSPEEYSYKGLLPLIKGMQGFVNIAFGKDTPWDTFLGLVTGTVAFGQELIMQMAKWGGGYATCIVIGLLFFLIFPIVACCFCCCRTCCNNCGGKMVQKRNDSTPMFRACYIITLFVSCTFLGCGMICTYVTNERMTTLFSDIATTVDNNIADLDRYGNNTLMQVNYVAKDGFNFTAKVMLRDLNNIGPIVGGAVQDSLNKEAGVQDAFDQLLAMDPLLESLVTGLTDVQVAKNKVITSVDDLETAMNSVATDIDNTFSTCGGACGTAPDTSGLKKGSNFDPNSMPDFTAELAKLKKVQSSNITGLVIEGQQEFKDISKTVTTESAGVITTITGTIDTFEGVINDALSGISDMLSIFDSISNITGPIGNLGDTKIGGSMTIDDLEKYRWMGGVGLTCFVLLILVLQLVGLILGCVGCCCCGDKNSLPTERGAVSNCGGLLLMASVGFVFIFGALIMLLVWLTYLVGAPLEKLVCVNLRDPEYTIFKNLIDGGDPASGPYSTIMGSQEGYLLGEMVFSDSSVPLTVSGLLTACEDNAPAWNALYIDRFFNISDVLDYKSTIDIDGEIDKINVDLSTIEIVSSDTKTELGDMRDAILGIDFKGLIDELSTQTVDADFAGMRSNLQTAADKIDGQAALSTVHANLLQSISDLQSIEDTEYPAVKTSQDEMLVTVVELNKTSNPAPNQIDTLLVTLENTQTQLRTEGDAIVKNESKVFAVRVLAIADQFVTFVNGTIRNDLGRCKPISNLYQSVLINTLCGSIIDSWNCVWFSLGWCLAFMVLGIILSTKLAKHLRRMKELHPDDPDKENKKYNIMDSGSGTGTPYGGPGAGKVHPI